MTMGDERQSKSPATPPENVDSSYADSPQQISAAPSSTASQSPDNFNDDDDFEFAFAVANPETHLSSTADELFSDGQIRRIYPVFNRDLLLNDDAEKLCRQPLLELLIDDGDASISHSSSLDHDLEALPAGSYCVWKPGSQSPETVRKSSSTGSSRRRRIRDFVLGRSNSDGKEKFMFIAAAEKSSVEKEAAVDEGKKKGKEKKKATEFDLLTAHRMFYGQSGNGSTARVGTAAGRKSYLPYKTGIVGFFARVNGIGRVDHPF